MATPQNVHTLMLVTMLHYICAGGIKGDFPETSWWAQCNHMNAWKWKCWKQVFQQIWIHVCSCLHCSPYSEGVEDQCPLMDAWTNKTRYIYTMKYCSVTEGNEVLITLQCSILYTLELIHMRGAELTLVTVTLVTVAANMPPINVGVVCPFCSYFCGWFCKEVLLGNDLGVEGKEGFWRRELHAVGVPG